MVDGKVQENAARKPQGLAHGLERSEIAARANDAVVLSYPWIIMDPNDPKDP